MNLNIFKRNIKKDTQVEQRFYTDSLGFNSVSSFGGGIDSAMRLSAVYRAVDLISDSIAMLPISITSDSDGYKSRVTDHPAYRLINQSPNGLMSRYQFIKLLISSTILRGNGYAYIKRDKRGNAIELQFLRSESVIINYDELRGKLFYQTAAIKGIIEPCNMIHIIKNSYNGVNGISVISHAFNTLQVSSDTEKQAGDFFKSGCNLSGYLSTLAPMQKAQIDNAKSTWMQTYNGISGGVAVLNGGMTYTPIQISNKDAQLLESRQFNLTDIARFFGISPVLLGDLTHSSYSTIEATQLAFLSQTLQPWIELIELEFSRKLFRPSEQNLSINIDETKLIKTDKAALATYYQQLFNISAITPNEIRKELGLQAISGGEKTYLQLNMISTESISKDEKNPEK